MDRSYMQFRATWRLQGIRISELGKIGNGISPGIPVAWKSDLVAVWDFEGNPNN